MQTETDDRKKPPMPPAPQVWTEARIALYRNASMMLKGIYDLLKEDQGALNNVDNNNEDWFGEIDDYDYDDAYEVYDANQESIQNIRDVFDTVDQLNDDFKALVTEIGEAERDNERRAAEAAKSP